jgi:hypothetical protein
MCSPSPIVYGFRSCDLPKNMDTIVFSVNDKGLKSTGEVDADDVITHAFGEDNGHHRHMLYRMITEIHHMLPDGTVRILACGGKKLQDAIVLTPDECMAREIARVGGRGVA